MKSRRILNSRITLPSLDFLSHRFSSNPVLFQKSSGQFQKNYVPGVVEQKVVNSFSIIPAKEASVIQSETPSLQIVDNENHPEVASQAKKKVTLVGARVLRMAFQWKSSGLRATVKLFVEGAGCEVFIFIELPYGHIVRIPKSIGISN